MYAPLTLWQNPYSTVDFPFQDPGHVVGAFGDNLDASANGLAERIGLDAGQRDVAARLGRCINYNGYGASLDDLHFTPTELFEAMRPFATPFDFCSYGPSCSGRATRSLESPERPSFVPTPPQT